MDLSKRFILNVFSSYGSLLAMGLITFFFTPLLISNLGTARYGLWIFVLSISHYSGIFDLGFLSAIRRFQSEAFAKGNEKRINEVFSASLKIYTLLGIAAFFACLILIYLLPCIINIPQTLYREFTFLMAAVGLFIFCTFIQACFTGIIFAANRIDLEKFITAVMRAIVAGLSLVLIFNWRKSLHSPGLALIISGIAGLPLAYMIAKRLFPRLRFSLAGKKPSIGSDMLKFGRYAMGVAVFGIIILHTPKVIVGAFLDMESVAKLAIPLILVYHLYTFIQATALPVFTVASRLNAGKDTKALGALYVRSSRLCFALAVSISVPLVVFGENFIGFWVGGDFAWTWKVLGIILAGEVFRFAQFPGVHILTAVKNIRPVSLLEGLHAVFLIGTMLILMVRTELGLFGVAIAVAVTSFIFKGILLPIYTCRQLRLKLRSYWIQAYAAPLAIGLFLLVCFSLVAGYR